MIFEQKNQKTNKLCIFMPNYAYHKHLYWLGPHYFTKASCEISASSFKDFWAKVEKVQKTHELSIIMLIDPNIIF